MTSNRFFITSKRRRRHGIRGVAITLALCLAGAVVAIAPTAAQSNDGVIFGAASSPRNGETQIESIQRLERQLGTTLPFVRVFERWDSVIDNRYNNWIVDGGRGILMSIKPQRENGQIITWRSIANAQPGSALHNDMLRFARELKAVDGDVWLALHHEPEAQTDAWGSPADFQNAWRKIHSVLEGQNVDVDWVLTMTAWSFAVNTSDRRSIGNWYPGGAFVDFIGADLYNWNQCRNPQEVWRTLRSGLDPVMNYAEARGKQVMLPEFGVHASNGQAKADWLDDVRSLMKEPRYARGVAAISYFDSIDPGVPGCQWPFETSSQSLAAGQRLAQDPFFGGSGGSTPAPAPTTTRAPAPTTTTTRAPAPTTTRAPAPTTTTTRAPAPAPTTTSAPAPAPSPAPTPAPAPSPSPAPNPSPGPTPTPVMCGGQVATIVGTSGGDVLRGTDGPDVIAGLQGNDVIQGLGGDDILCGGTGNDSIFGGQGADTLYGAQGADALYSADLNDRNDSDGARIFGGAGPDRIFGSNRWDRAQGGDGNDQFLMYEGRDWIRGGAGNDRITGGGAIDDVRGGPGRDWIAVSAGDDVRGGIGIDTCTNAHTGARAWSCERN